ncbi:hypothetical protein AB0E69_09300 [Kribbella sp. NPDC026611]|uniref:hypothetical protein n=1 Tax=Kribbella sp. NPDC026611 TaxID=3154911 RepID=UPI0033E087F7
MSALYRYQLTSVLLSQRYLPPMLIFFGVMAVGTTSDNGPLQSSYAFGVLVMLVCSTWLTVAVVNQEDPTQHRITLVMIGSSLRVLSITIAVVLTWCVPLIVFGLVIPLVTGDHVVTAGNLAVGAVAQLASAMVGIAIGVLCSRLVIRRIGIAMLTAATAILIMLVRWISPIRALMKVLSDDRSAGHNAGPIASLAVLCAVVLTAAVLATRSIADRKE